MKVKASFFDLEVMPEVALSEEVLERLAEESVDRRLTVPGVQRKLSLHLSREGAPRLTLVNYPTGYILKPQTPLFAHLPEAEDLVMDIAELAGVQTVPHGLVEAGGDLAYITRRVDRGFRDGAVVARYAMEDFCQLSDRLTQDKYKGSYERCAALIRRYSQRPGFDLSELFLRLVVCFLAGNSDMHLKNFSLLEDAPGSRAFSLSPAYDLLPVNLVMPEDKEETALTLNGKKSRLRRKDFLQLAEACQLPAKAAEKMIAGCLEKLPRFTELCQSAWLPEAMKEGMVALMQSRAERLAG